MLVIKILLLFFSLLDLLKLPDSAMEAREKCTNKAKLPEMISYRSSERLMKNFDRFKS